MKICMIGFGHAGQALCALFLKQGQDFYDLTHEPLVVSAIITKSRGVLMDPQGIDYAKALDTMKTRGHLHDMPCAVLGMSVEEVMLASEADLVLEMSALSIQDGQPAIHHIETAFKLGKHAITANKGPLAWQYHALKRQAEAKGLHFLYETTVMDGTPVFNLAKYGLPGCKIIGFKGILNSTTNFILDEMAKGLTQQEAILQAKKRGFAEADPSLDIEGWDAAAKTAALANVLMHAQTNPYEVKRTGIENITHDDIKAAGQQGEKIKLLCEAWLEEGQVVTEVSPKRVPLNDMLAYVDATTSVLTLMTDLMGQVMVVEKAPEIEQTAYGLYSDLLTLHRLISGA